MGQLRLLVVGLPVALVAGCAGRDWITVDDSEFCEEGVLQELGECTIRLPPPEPEGEDARPEIRDPDEFGVDYESLKKKTR